MVSNKENNEYLNRKSQQNIRMNMRGEERTWMMNRAPQAKINVSKQSQNNRMHVLEWSKSSMYNNHPIDQSINQS